MFWVANAWSDHTPSPTNVTLVGDLQTELGCPGDWQPDCLETGLVATDDEVWSATFALPAGEYEYKIALRQTWQENYGVHGQDGLNIPLRLEAPASVTFTYRHDSHTIRGAAPGVESGVDAASLVIRRPAWRDELLTRVQKDQEARFTAIAWDQEHGTDGVVDKASLSEAQREERTALWDSVRQIDEDNTAWLKEQVRQHGWPAYSDVGKEAGDAAWLLVQHADLDPAFQRRCLDLMSQLPRDEISLQSMAYLTDRVLIAEGKNQVYGTQLVQRAGEWVPATLDDPARVDELRADVGLPPLADYLEMHARFLRGEQP